MISRGASLSGSRNLAGPRKPSGLFMGDRLPTLTGSILDGAARIDAADTPVGAPPVGKLRSRSLSTGAAVAAIMEVDGIESMVAFRDPHGIRPASYGRNADGAWLVCSETVCLDVLDFEFVGHVPPGAMMIFRPGEEPIVRHLLPKPLKHAGSS